MIISQVLPNPVGKDAEGEWIKLFNNGNQTVNLSGWKLKDASGKVFTLGNKVIAPGDYLELGVKLTKLSVNNDGETLFLYNAASQLIDRTAFTGRAAEGEVFVRAGDNLVAQDSRNKQQASTSSVRRVSLTADANQLVDYDTTTISNSISSEYLLVGLLVAAALSLMAVMMVKKFDLWKADQ